MKKHMEQKMDSDGISQNDLLMIPKGDTNWHYSTNADNKEPLLESRCTARGSKYLKKRLQVPKAKTCMLSTHSPTLELLGP